MNRPSLLPVSNIGNMTIQQYERYLPTAFDESLSILEKLNKVIWHMNEVGQLTNDMLKKWNEVIDWLLKDGLKLEVENVLERWLIDNTLSNIINNVIFGELNVKINDAQKKVHHLERINALPRDAFITSQYYYWKQVYQNAIDADFILGVVPDTHFGWEPQRYTQYNSKREVGMYNNIINKLPNVLDTYHLGDIINGDISDSNVFESISEFDVVTKDYIKLMGNHDGGGYYEDLQYRKPEVYGKMTENHRLSKDKEHMYYFVNNKVTKMDEETHAFYKDYEKQKLRIIGINTSDLPLTRRSNGQLRYPDINTYGISPKQIKWLHENAFNFLDKGEDSQHWRVIILSHVPLVPQNANSNFSWEDSNGGVFNVVGGKYPNLFVGGTEEVANEGILRQMIGSLNKGTSNTYKPYLNQSTMYAIDSGYYYPSEPQSKNPTQTSRKQYTKEDHYENYINWGSMFSIDGTTNEFSVTTNNPYPVRVIGCISGHTHKDLVHVADSASGKPIYHIALSAFALGTETDEFNEEDFAMTIIMVKNRELFFFRQGENKGEVSNPILIGGHTDYASKTLSKHQFKY